MKMCSAQGLTDAVLVHHAGNVNESESEYQDEAHCTALKTGLSKEGRQSDNVLSRVTSGAVQPALHCWTGSAAACMARSTH